MAEPRCSVIVPFHNEAAMLRQNLARLSAWVGGQELILVDGGSCDGGWDIAAGHARRLLCAPQGRASQMNAGAAAARGEYLLFLHCDCRPRFALGELLRRIPAGTLWGFCDARPEPASGLLRLVGWAMHWRSRLTRIATGDQMIFVARRRFTELGGYAELPLMEDVELSKRLRRHGAPLALPLRLDTSPRYWRRRGTLRAVALMWRLRLAFWCGASASGLARRYYGEPPRAPCLLVQFAREPVAGRVKTRLRAALSEAQACSLHSAMVERTARLLGGHPDSDMQIWVDGSGGHPLFRRLADCCGGEALEQPAGDLGRRMEAAMARGLARYRRVVLVGSDCPALDSAYLERALRALDSAELVLGPALDGGYVLIGCRVLSRGIFEGIEWGGPKVLAQTLAAASSLRLRARLLPPLPDIDRPEDLRRLPEPLREHLDPARH